MSTTRIKVRGMAPSRIPAREDSTIIMNTMPLAPSRAVPGKKMNCTRPDARAVNRMHPSRRRLPYFSSSGGPMTSSRVMLPM